MAPKADPCSSSGLTSRVIPGSHWRHAEHCLDAPALLYLGPDCLCYCQGAGIEEAGEIKSVFADISIKDDKWGRTGCPKILF